MYAEAVDDGKLRVLAYEDRWHFVALLCLKSQGILDEKNQELRLQQMCVKFGMESVELEKTMKRLVTAGLVTERWQPKNWRKRQYLSDSSTNRVRKHRETLRKRSRNGPDTEQIQNRTEQIQMGGARTARAPTAKRIPADFNLTEELRAIALAEAVDADREFSKFTDYWRSASGAHARKHDWEATWRNWCRKAADIARNKPTSSASQQRTWRPGPEDSGPC